MKNILMFLVIFLSIKNTHSQNERHNETSLIQTDTLKYITDVENIRTEIKNSINSYKKIEKLNDTTGYNCAFFKGNELKVIMKRAIDKRDNRYVDKKIEWYFFNNQLIFSKQTWFDIVTNKLIDDEKIYLKNEELVAFIKFDKVITSSSQEFRNINNQLPTIIAKLKNEYLK